mmetsp:Transcript_53915/g.122883  ORF Transcript_53915/g.122883 Transcript_53915/m.122883 type:complete len:420 (-) Transcript_53915:74-1333(-)
MVDAVGHDTGSFEPGDLDENIFEKEHVFLAAASIGILLALVLLTGGLSQPSSPGSKPRKPVASFTSRFSTKESMDSLTFACAMAALAECVNTQITPDLGTILGVDLTGTFLNLAGALLGGVSSAVSLQGGAAELVANAVSGGFVAAFTSFIFFVEQSAMLAAQDTPGPNALAPLYLLGCLLLGPLCFALGRRLALAALPPPACKPEPAGPGHPIVRGVKSATMACVAASVAVVGAAPGEGALDASLELLTGAAMVALACVVGEWVGSLVEEGGWLGGYGTQRSSINWATCLNNALALSMATIFHVALRTELWRQALRQIPAASAGGRTSVVGGVAWLLGPWGARFAPAVGRKLIGGFCGALSGFGAFSEDVAQTYREALAAASPSDGALANWAVNAGVALAFQALLIPIYENALGPLPQ